MTPGPNSILPESRIDLDKEMQESRRRQVRSLREQAKDLRDEAAVMEARADSIEQRWQLKEPAAS